MGVSSGKYEEKMDRTKPFTRKDHVSFRSCVAVGGSSPPPDPAWAVSDVDQLSAFSAMRGRKGMYRI